jgi:uncharacterized protein with HEPN domain
MAGMRDRLLHGYFKIDYALVWETIKETLPSEKIAIRRIIHECRDRDR